MPQFVEQATTYGYDKASPYIDTACGKVPLLQSIVNRLVPYAKPSVQLADKIVDTALGLASKPVELLQGTVTSIKRKASDCKEAVITKVAPIRERADQSLTAAASKVSHVKGIVADRLSEYRGSVTSAFDRYKSIALDKKCALLQILQEQRALLVTKSAEVASWTSAKLQAVATRLHLMKLRDMVYQKASVAKSYMVEVRDAAYRKGEAGKNYAMTFIEAVSGKAYSSAAAVVGGPQVDRVLEVVASCVPVKTVKVASTSTAELEKNEKKDQ
jgi:hypothetical protein